MSYQTPPPGRTPTFLFPSNLQNESRKKPDGERFCPGTLSQCSAIEGNVPRLRARLSHFVGHLPLPYGASRRLCGKWAESSDRSDSIFEFLGSRLGQTRNHVAHTASKADSVREQI